MTSGAVRAVDAERVAVVVSRGGRVPAGADEAVAEAGGHALVVGSDAEAATHSLPSARRAWWASTGTSQVGLAQAVAAAVRSCQLVVLPGSPDGRDLAPRLAALLRWPLLAGAVAVAVDGPDVTAELLRVDGQVTVPARVTGGAVATLWPGARAGEPAAGPTETIEIRLEKAPEGSPGDVSRLGMIEPDPATMDLSEARRVLGGGAGLVPLGTPTSEARATFDLLVEVAAALKASAGATRVVTDAGWMDYDRQIGTTGVAVDPDLYVALGVSGASQHVGGLGQPVHTVSVNVDPSCPMTAAADLGIVTDAPALLQELARRLGVVPR